MSDYLVSVSRVVDVRVPEHALEHDRDGRRCYVDLDLSTPTHAAVWREVALHAHLPHTEVRVNGRPVWADATRGGKSRSARLYIEANLGNVSPPTTSNVQDLKKEGSGMTR